MPKMNPIFDDFARTVEDDNRWLAMLDDRNKSIHLYRQEYADQIYEKLPDYLELLKTLLAKLARR